MFLLRDVPDNGGFMVAAYTIVAVVLLAYSIMLVFRVRKEEQREEGRGKREMA